MMAIMLIVMKLLIRLGAGLLWVVASTVTVMDVTFVRTSMLNMTVTGVVRSVRNRLKWVWQAVNDFRKMLFRVSALWWVAGASVAATV